MVVFLLLLEVVVVSPPPVVDCQCPALVEMMLFYRERIRPHCRPYGGLFWRTCDFGGYIYDSKSSIVFADFGIAVVVFVVGTVQQVADIERQTLPPPR
jgi:hypothetical protein